MKLEYKQEDGKIRGGGGGEVFFYFCQNGKDQEVWFVIQLQLEKEEKKNFYICIWDKVNS